jgi:hypothetical protein
VEMLSLNTPPPRDRLQGLSVEESTVRGILSVNSEYAVRSDTGSAVANLLQDFL